VSDKLQMTTKELAAEEEDLMTKAEMDALKVLSRNHRLLVTIVPKRADDRFMAKFTAWQNFVLDTMLLPPLWLPVSEKPPQGDGLVCPYCNMPATQNLDMHAPDCEWRQAAYRWGAAQLQINKEFPEA
jgi:hypothetical protein